MRSLQMRLQCHGQLKRGYLLQLSDAFEVQRLLGGELDLLQIAAKRKENRGNEMAEMSIEIKPNIGGQRATQNR